MPASPRPRVARCRSCRAPLTDPPPGVRRCGRCQASFEQWLRGDGPTEYTPRRDGCWADLERSDEK